eukprot:3562823-Rhodomonas_salina.1
MPVLEFWPPVAGTYWRLRTRYKSQQPMLTSVPSVSNSTNTCGTSSKRYKAHPRPETWNGGHTVAMVSWASEEAHYGWSRTQPNDQRHRLRRCVIRSTGFTFFEPLPVSHAQREAEAARLAAPEECSLPSGFLFPLCGEKRGVHAAAVYDDCTGRAGSRKHNRNLSLIHI